MVTTSASAVALERALIICYRPPPYNAQVRKVPFFLIRIDNAGNVFKRFAAVISLFSIWRHVPRWNIHDSFRQPGKVMTQIICIKIARVIFLLLHSVAIAPPLTNKIINLLPVAVRFSCQ